MQHVNADNGPPLIYIYIYIYILTCCVNVRLLSRDKKNIAVNLLTHYLPKMVVILPGVERDRIFPQFFRGIGTGRD